METGVTVFERQFPKGYGTRYFDFECLTDSEIEMQME